MILLTADAEQLRILAALVALPEDDALDALHDLRQSAAWLDSSLCELGTTPLGRWQAEYTRLFLSGYPKTLCPPYESAYRQGTMGGPPMRELAELYRRAGLKAEDVPADYLGTMLECAAYLQEQGMEELLAELVEEHMKRWVPRFARDLQDQAGLELYRELGRQIEGLFPETSTRE